LPLPPKSNMPSPVHLIQCLQHAAPDSFGRGSYLRTNHDRSTCVDEIRGPFQPRPGDISPHRAATGQVRSASITLPRLRHRASRWRRRTRR
jgi:hypothetical protein